MALEIFRLVGSVFVDTDEANKSLQKTDKSAESFGKTLLNGIGTAAKWAAGIAAATGAVATGFAVSAVKSYAEYEQLVGGIQTLFKDGADAVIKNSESAYRRAGINASTYLDAVTSFSASLLQSLEGDTVAAAQYADMAITDMSDNANKMGTSMESIIQTYQSLARGNYAMLDNLKLGYGGTKTEMERLLADADAINAKQGVITQYSLNNLSDIYEAIHVVQTEMGIAGATSLEATTTIEGGIKLIKAKLGDLTTQIGGAFAPAVQAVIGMIIDGLPAVEEAVNKLVPHIEHFSTVLLPSVIEKITECCTWISENGDKIVEWTGYIVAAGAAVATFLVYINWGKIMTAASTTLNSVTASVKAFNVALNKNKIAIVVAAVVGLITWLVYLYNTNEEFRAKVDEVVTFIWTKLQAVFGWLQEHAFPVIQALGALFKTYLLPIIEELYAFYVSTLIPAIDKGLAWCKENIPSFIGQIVEWVQTKLLPALQAMIAWAQANVIPVIQKIAAWIKETLVPAIGTIITWVEGHLLPAVGSVISWISDKVGSFFEWFIGIFQSTSDSTGGIWEKIKGFFSSAWDFIVGVWEACQPFFQGVWDGVILPVADMVEEMIGAFQMAWDVIVLVWEKCQPFFSALWEAIKIAVTALGAALTAVFVATWEYIKVVWGSVGPYFKSLWETLKAIFSVVKTFWGGFFKAAWEYIKAVWNVAIDFFTMVWAGIKAVFAVVKGVLSGDFSDAWEAIKNLWNRAKEFFNSVWTGIKNVFGSVGSWFGNTFKAAWEAVKKAFSSWGSFFGNLWTTIKDKFSAIGTNISNAISSAVKSGLNGVISKIESIINSGVNMINGAIGLINQIPGVSIGKLSKLDLPRLAKGGVVDEPTLAQIGEDGAEAVVPLERNTGWIDRLASKIAQTSVVQYGQPTDEKSLDKVISKMDELLDALQANQTITLNKREFARIVKEVG